MKTKRLYIVFVLDASGSMVGQRQESIDGVNKYVREQIEGKPENVEIFFSLMTFHIETRMVYNSKPMDAVQELTPEDYAPSGGTALFDAIGRAVLETDNIITREQSPDEYKVLMVILTDGENNASTEFTKEKVTELIDAKKGTGWDFVFLGMGISDWQAGGMGIHTSSSLKPGTSPQMFAALSSSTKGYTSGYAADEVVSAASILDNDAIRALQMDDIDDIDPQDN